LSLKSGLLVSSLCFRVQRVPLPSGSDDDGSEYDVLKVVNEGADSEEEGPESDLDNEAKAEIDEAIDEITADLRQALRDKKRRGAGYLNLASYACFCMFYMVVVYVQSDVYNAFTVGLQG
jgi:hypothetical protein